MKAWPIFQFILLITLLARPSEGFFLEYPKKALQQFFDFLKTKKQPKSNAQHYHMHYYPIPYAMLLPKVPVIQDVETFYDDTTMSFDWPDYKYLPQLSTIMSDLFDAERPTLDDTRATIDRKGQGLLLQIPNRYMLQLLRRWQQRQLAKAMT